MKKKVSAGISSFLNLALAVLEFYCIFLYFARGGGIKKVGFGVYRYFTFASNTLAAVAAALLLPSELCCAFGRKGKTVPTALSVLKLVGTTGVTITFLVVIAYLTPLQGLESMFLNENLYLHGIFPVLAMISFIFFDGGGPISRKQSLPALLPLVIYAVVYTTMVVFIGGWEDFYGLNPGGFWPVSMIILLALNALVVMLLRKLHNRFAA